MTIPHKAALSLFISVFLCSGFAVLAYRGFFDLIESRFYNPSITRALTGEIDLDTGVVEAYFNELEGRFTATLEEDAVRRSFLPYQNGDDIFERSKRYGILLENTGGLQSIRFIDAGGRRIHYSTLASDILRQDTGTVSYRNYENGSVPFENLAVSSHGTPRITLEAADRIIISLPFHDSQDVYRGTVLFALSDYGLTERLAEEGRIPVGETVSLIAEPAGIVTRLPAFGQDALIPLISALWSGGITGVSALESANSASSVLISSKTAQGIFTGRFVPESLLTISAPMRLLLLVSCFFTIYLLIFLLLNLRQDPLAIADARLRKLRSLLLDAYEHRKADEEDDRWSGNLDRRREDVRAELKKDIRPKRGRQEKELDALIDRFWTELVAIIKTLDAASPGTARDTAEAGAVPSESEDRAELEELAECEELEELEEAAAGTEAAAGAKAAGTPATAEELEAFEELEELELEEPEPEELEILEEAEEAASIATASIATASIATASIATASIATASIADVALQIELSPVPEQEAAQFAAQEKLEELEIVSPFTSLLSGIDDTTVLAAATLESIDTTCPLSLLHRLFTQEKSDTPAEAAVAPPAPSIPDAPANQDDGVIEYREGINYVSEKALHSEPEDGTLDPRLKRLIDSVLNKPAP